MLSRTLSARRWEDFCLGMFLMSRAVGCACLLNWTKNTNRKARHTLIAKAYRPAVVAKAREGSVPRWSLAGSVGVYHQVTGGALEWGEQFHSAISDRHHVAVADAAVAVDINGRLEVEYHAWLDSVR